MRLKENILLTDTGFVFDPDTGDAFSTNPIGKELMEKLKANIDLNEITVQITDKYNVDAIQFQRYFDDFVIMLRHYNLITDTE